MKLLIVEDNQNLVANLFDYFEGKGHILDAAPDGLVGKWLATTQHYDGIILDWNLPKLDGFQLLKELREEYHCDTPIIMLTARDELPDKICGFKAGADDYLTKPFELQELEVRLEALMARSKRTTTTKVLEIADLSFDLSTMEVTRAGQTINLYPIYKKLLRTLMEASPSIVSHSQLGECIWGDSPPESDRLRAYIHDLRRKIDAPFSNKLIHTLPRVGYRLAEL
ncbi:response regulator transcription factor [Cellvibrio mixtus]|uniref:response regulator transcription factor n=1 Tax=Cellvibrio mixtus TaxID=39650 RepID=UPI000587E9B4|nr:response regulator transcription factor [Cellvibrio mixtus]